MSIQDQLVTINTKFQTLHQDFERIDTDIKGLDGRFSSDRSNIQAKWEKERQKILSQKEDVLKYYRIAKDNSSKDLVSAGISGQIPDIGRLNRMIDQINIYNRNDPVAGQIIDLCSHYIAYLDKQLADLGKSEQNDLQQASRRKDGELTRLNQKKRQILQECEAYLRGKEVASLVTLFEGIHRDYEINSSYFNNWGRETKRKRMMLFGFQDFKLDVPQMLCAPLKQSLGKHFDERNRIVNCPCGFTTDSHEELIVEYVDRNEQLLKEGIQALILNFLRYFRTNELRVSLFDYIHYNSDLIGPLGILTGGKHAIISRPPSDGKTLQQDLAILADSYRKIEGKLATQTVFSFNRSHRPEERIPLRLLIINRVAESYRTSEDEKIAYLVNNAEKFGIFVVLLSKSIDGGSKDTKREQQYLAKAKDYIRIISNSRGDFFVENDVSWLPFRWLSSVDTIPADFAAKITAASKPSEIGSKYFSRYSITTPHKSVGKRKPLVIPFSIDEDDNVVSCSFENDSFAAYVMGAAGSGKSTLLHTIISGLIMNYHPDEVELWLLDFKMLEFKRYVDHCPPHIKYILLEKSEDLVFDIIDRLTDLLDERQYVFSQNGWSKLTDVPVERNMPAVFIIIDEFAQMSQILKETKGLGYDADYTIKLENLLAKGRALGIKFIFASQTYTTGISGLTETACKQIQMRFALKNTTDEIKQTLNLTSDQITPELSRTMASMPAYQTIFKWSDDEDHIHIGQYRNMYTEGDEIERLVDTINAKIKPLPPGSSTDDTTCIAKRPIMIDGTKPKTFKSQIHYYQEYESSSAADEYDDDDILIYPGVPCSFNLARPFALCNATAENILIAGGDRDSKVNIILSILNCCTRRKLPIEIWAHERSPYVKRYKDTVFAKKSILTDLGQICSRVAEVKESIQSRKAKEQLIVCFGYESLAADFDILGDGVSDFTPAAAASKPRNNDQPDLSEILQRVRECQDPEEKRRIVEEYNRLSQQSESAAEPEPEDPSGGIYDARADVEWIIRRSSNFGVHFLFCFDQGRDFINLRFDENLFRHKIMFSMSKDESLSILGNRKANEVGDGTCIYSSGKESFTIRPHIYRGVPCNGWVIDDGGTIVQRR